ncbi:MAG: HEAT repeat domain-containing protein [Planctomycetota bacterium]
MKRRNLGIRFGRTLLLGTPHDPAVDLEALKAMSKSVLNVRSAYDKINRNVSNELAELRALDGYPFWNQRMDKTLGGRLVRHYVFLEPTPENVVQYGTYLKRGRWPEAQRLDGKAVMDVEALHGFALWLQKHGILGTEELYKHLALEALKARDTAYYGALLLGQIGGEGAREALKEVLEKEGTSVLVRREIYQALGNLADARDLRYLQRRRKQDEGAGDVLRDVLREWKQRRIR